MSVNDAYTDVVELCALLQCLGFSVKSLNTTDTNVSQDGGTRTVVINCQSSGLHVVLESASLSCSCPVTNLHNSGVWQVSGVSGGKQLDKEFGCTLLAALPKGHRERLNKELREMIRCIKEHNESDSEKPKVKEVINKSASMVELSTPEKRLFQSKIDTPTRYRSLDTLTAAKKDVEQSLPEPGRLTKQAVADAFPPDSDKVQMCRRQSTYTLSSTQGSLRRRNKTSSPIHEPPYSLLENLIEAEKIAETLRNKLAYVIREYGEEGRQESSMSSLVLDVSKISIMKAESSKAQFASSPNLSGLVAVQENNLAKSKLKRLDSVSTPSLLPRKQTPNEKPSRLRRLSPNLFKKKETPKTENSRLADKGSKLSSIFKPKIVTPVLRPAESSTSLSASKKRFSHIKSTIPRPSPQKKD